MTTGHMKGQGVCVCEGENVCQYVKPGRPSPFPPNTHLSLDWRHSHRCVTGRVLFRLLPGGDLLPLSELLALLILCFSICCLSPSSATAVRRFRGRECKEAGGAKKRAVILLDALSTFIGLFPRPAAIHFVWFKGFACQIWRYLFFCYTHANRHM